MKRILSIILVLIVIILIAGCKSSTIVKTNKEEDNEYSNKDDNMNEIGAKITISVNGLDYTATLENNESANELLKLLPLNITMQDLNNNEKYYYLNTSLKTNSVSIKKIEIGDIMLYGNNCLVIFYDSFDTSYNYTRIGKIDDISNLKNIFGTKSIMLSISN